MKLSTKIIFTLLVGSIAVGASVLFNHFAYNYFTKRLDITEKIDAIRVNEKALNHLVLQNDTALYLNQDDFNHKINAINRLILTIQNDPHFKKEHPKTLQALNQYQHSFNSKVQAVYDFQTASSAIKNSTMAIPALKQKAILTFDLSLSDDHLFFETISKTALLALMAKSTRDGTFLNNIEKQLCEIENIHFKDSRKKLISTALVLNLHIFREVFPQYLEAINGIEESKTNQNFDTLQKAFSEENSHKILKILYFSTLLVVLYLISLFLIIYFLIRNERDSKTDKLTAIGNRKGYEAFIQKSSPVALLLININKFKNYNDFYGTSFGDKILFYTVQRLLQIRSSQKHCTLFRLGGDEFGIVMTHFNPVDLEYTATIILEAFQKEPITVDGIDISVSLSISISTSKPLLETADMAQKELKKNRIKNIMVYHKGLNLIEAIQTNMLKTHELKYAIENGALFPHFQPIISLSTGKIEKYEALARVRTTNGEIRSIFEYLDVLKESSYYTTLTHTMIQKSCAIMHNKECQFSINLSIDDINDPATLAYILQTLNYYPNIASRIIFEILESEAIRDYQNISEFIRQMKSYGCKIAIDDFGSGYSNFTHILNLDIDILKLDGSLIRDLNTNSNAMLIVEMIVAFAKKGGISTVAEFVCDEEIYTIVKALGIDYAQGYYTGKPAPLQ